MKLDVAQDHGQLHDRARIYVIYQREELTLVNEIPLELYHRASIDRSRSNAAGR